MKLTCASVRRDRKAFMVKPPGTVVDAAAVQAPAPGDEPRAFEHVGTYSSEGRKGLIAEGGTSREAETRKLFEAAGGTVQQYLFSLGEFDFIIIAEMSDDVAALVPPLLASGTGSVGVKTVKLVSPQQLDGLAEEARTLKLRSPGE